MLENEMVAIDCAGSDNSPMENVVQKEIVASQVKGHVKWFNVDLGYGFINREDTKDDVFVHHTAIVKYNPKHQLSSLANGEFVEFDVVRGKKGLEAANVTGPNGDEVKGSRYATNLYAGRYRFRHSSNYGKRYYSRKVYGGRSAQQEEQAVQNEADVTKPEAQPNGVEEKRIVPIKKFSKNRKVRVALEDGPLRRSSSLPPNIETHMNSRNQRGRPRRRFGRGGDGWTPFRTAFTGNKRRSRRPSAKQTKPTEKVESGHEDGVNEHNIKPNIEVSGDGDSAKSTSQRDTKEEKVGEKCAENENSRKSTSEKTENSGKSSAIKDKTGGKNPSNMEGPKNANGKRGKRRRRGGRRVAPRSSSTDASTQTPSAKEETTKTEEGNCGGDGDGAGVMNEAAA